MIISDAPVVIEAAINGASPKQHSEVVAVRGALGARGREGWSSHALTDHH
jgi:hypothetical protein